MKNKKASLDKLNNILEMPKEICTNEPKVTIVGFGEMIVENYKGILEYENYFVRINTYIGVININGKVVIKPEYDNITVDNYYDAETKYQKTGFIVCNKGIAGH